MEMASLVGEMSTDEELHEDHGSGPPMYGTDFSVPDFANGWIYDPDLISMDFNPSFCIQHG